MLSQRIFVTFVVFVEDCTISSDAHVRYLKGADHLRTAAFLAYHIYLGASREISKLSILLYVGAEDYVSVFKNCHRSLISRMGCKPCRRSSFGRNTIDVLAFVPVGSEYDGSSVR